MQAIFMFAIVGLIAGGLSFIARSVSESMVGLRDRQVAETERFFEEVEAVYTRQIVPQLMAVPEEAELRDYLVRDEIRQGVNWSMAPLGQDAWKKDITGFVSREFITILAATDGTNVTVPVTAFLLVSAGPDREVDPALQAEIDALNASSTLRDITRVEATAGTDDIVLAFTTQKAQEKRWLDVQGRIGQIAGIMERHYAQQIQRFQGDIANFYTLNVADFFVDDGAGGRTLSITEDMLNAWQAGAPGAPTFASLDTEAERAILGVEENWRFIEETSNLRINVSVLSSGSGFEDILRLELVNDGSPWGDASGTLTYITEVAGNV